MPDDVPLAAEPRPLTGLTLTGSNRQVGIGRWDLFYGLILAATVAVVVVTADPGNRTVALAALAAMAPWYLLVGRPLMISGDAAAPHRGLVYLAGIVVLFAIADFVAPNTWFMAIALNPQCYHVTTSRRALITVVALSSIGAASVGLAQHGQPGGVVTGVCLAIFAIGFSVAYGGYTAKIVERSQERAAFITQLEATRAELAEVSREAGALAERQRLAGEIHDTLAQGFSSILMLIQAADAALEQAPATARAQLALAAQTARENLAEARTLVSGLGSAELQARTLTDALRRITERSGAELGISVRFDADGAARPLPATTEVVLLRTGQEALANVRKHAAASRLAVRLRFAGDLVRLEVIDDGVGFDPATVNGGYGLRGMRGRVAEVGGTVTVRSALGEGTSVVVEVPA